MKKTILMTLLVLLAIASKGQVVQANNYAGVYKWKEVIQMQSCDVNGNLNNLNTISSIINAQKFIVVNVTGDFAIIKLWDYTIYAPHSENNANKLINRNITFAGLGKDDASNKDKTEETNGYVKLYKAKSNFFLYNFSGSIADYDNLEATKANTRNYGVNQVYFKVPLKYITQYAERSIHIAGSLALGAINYPFKYRLLPGKSDFSGSFNLGAAVGYKLPHDSLSKWTFTAPLIAFSISNINIDSVSALRNQSLLKSTNNFSAISFATGIIAENNKVQIGVFLGLDKISRLNNLQYGWVYQNKPWFSIGFGYSLFSTDKQAGKDTGAQQQ